MSRDLIPLSVPVIRGNEWRYVKQCLDTAWVSSVGSFVDRFERAVADRVGRAFGVATVNGTSALHVALQVAGIAPGDEVVVPALTFVSPANAVRYLGAFPVFVDVTDDHLQLDVAKLERFLRLQCQHRSGKLVNRATDRPVRALLPVHVLGHPVDMDPVLRLARQYDLVVVEDVAEGLGARYRGRPLGGHGLLACFSFNGNKIVTAGGGGMIVTDDGAVAQRCRYLTTQAKEDPVEYVHGEVGYNYRLTNVQAALGVAQLEMLDEYATAKRRIASRYRQGLAQVEHLTEVAEAEWAEATFWLYTVRLAPAVGRRASRDLLRFLASEGIESRPLWCPLHRLAPFRDCFSFEVEVADKAADEALSLPSSVDLTEAQQDRVIDAVRRFFAERER